MLIEKSSSSCLLFLQNFSFDVVALISLWDEEVIDLLEGKHRRTVLTKNVTCRRLPPATMTKRRDKARKSSFGQWM